MSERALSKWGKCAMGWLRTITLGAAAALWSTCALADVVIYEQHETGNSAGWGGASFTTPGDYRLDVSTSSEVRFQIEEFFTYRYLTYATSPDNSYFVCIECNESDVNNTAQSTGTSASYAFHYIEPMTSYGVAGPGLESYGVQPGWLITHIDSYDIASLGVYMETTGDVPVVFDWTLTITRLDAVPEPDTWALMIGGFGIVGSALRRRRRRAKTPA